MLPRISRRYKFHARPAYRRVSIYLIKTGMIVLQLIRRPEAIFYSMPR